MAHQGRLREKSEAARLSSAVLHIHIGFSNHARGKNSRAADVACIFRPGHSAGEKHAMSIRLPGVVTVTELLFSGSTAVLLPLPPTLCRRVELPLDRLFAVRVRRVLVSVEVPATIRSI